MRVTLTTWPHGTPSSATTLVRSLSWAGSSAASDGVHAASKPVATSIRAGILRARIVCFIAVLPFRSDGRELGRVCENSPNGFARRGNGIRQRRVGILQQGKDLHHQAIVGLSKLRQRRLELSPVELAELVQQVVDLVLEREFGHDTHRARFAQACLERLEVEGWR